jgi:hypothetical protein
MHKSKITRSGERAQWFIIATLVAAVVATNVLWMLHVQSLRTTDHNTAELIFQLRQELLQLQN